ncbi:transmembrane protein (macronuclear) [Tetrahymena thermophila SB210]|uniref:Transmembrane protein n=1 Tax=Tetrahymena thermophila (strain SB210) TaxID=312017 RepID=I7MJR2_TETTS|nr:transmembrane protein [Tetrahymena thermophila SB210]EAR97107.2 transmembrane protein [Tetrahymena thermophila SB210]|eukprot:XP_001017352.2 transmembrane protein [Tetrahymena thermophila SB210]
MSSTQKEQTQVSEIPNSPQKEASKKTKDLENIIKQYLLKFIKISNCSKTSQCKHDDGCILNVIVKTIKGLILGFSAKTALNLVGLLLNFKKIMKNPLSIFSIFNDSVRFGCFPGVFNLVMQSTLCLLRRQGCNQTLQYFLSGFLAGFLSLATRQKNNRSVWGIFLLSRGLECFYHSMANKGIIKKRNIDYTILFSVLMVFVGGIGYAYEPLCLPPGINKFYRLVTCEDDTDLTFRKCWIEIRNKKLSQYGIAPQNPLEALLLQKKSRKH